MNRPIPTSGAVAVAAFGLVPALLAVVVGPLGWAALIIDVVLAALVVVDFIRAPKASSLRVTRVIDEVISSNVRTTVKLVVESTSDDRVRGEVRDSLPSSGQVEEGALRLALDFTRSQVVSYVFTPMTRGDLHLGEVWVRLQGPLGLCVRQFTLAAAQTVKVFPDLRALSRDALSLARPNDDTAKRVLRVRSEGRDLESLREYRPGDDRRSIDWKATARRGRGIVRVYQPERNQTVLLLLDCGRHMAGEVLGRRKLDHAVDAALRVAKVSLERGDLVGVMAFATKVQVWLPPRKGSEQLKAIAHALYRVEATLEESDYGAALDLAFSRGVRRSLVVVMTDLVDSETSATLVKRTVRLVPRHLPLIASMRDDDLNAAATALPSTREAVLERVVAARLEAESKATVARVRDAGARVSRSSANDFGPATVNAYLDIKSRGLL